MLITAAHFLFTLHGYLTVYARETITPFETCTEIQYSYAWNTPEERFRFPWYRTECHTTVPVRDEGSAAKEKP